MLFCKLINYRFSQKSSINQFNVKRVNLKSYAKAIQVASYHGADLIVFPESGLFGAINRTVASLNYEYIPNANESITPCIDWNGQSSIDSLCVHSLSCLARGFKIYVAAILGEKVNCSLSNDPNCPDHGHYLFNTQILIDSTGKLIAKYHKYHLFFEPIHNIPVEPEVVTVSTTFGKLGFLICFDINYLQPAFNLINNQSVDTILFGAHWTDELPFLNAHRVQSGFSIEQNVNLLASGINDLPLGAVGSGIYQAGKGPIVYTADIMKGGSKLLIADLPKSRHENRSIDSRTGLVKIIEHNKIDESDHLPYKPWTLELDLFNYTKLTQQSDNIVSCSEKICCQVNYSMTKSSFPTTYYLLVKRWIRPTTKICEQFCGLVAYNLTDYAYITTQLYIRL
ncbi:pantetheine hydrolase VNN2-like [Panonychus citri]|uniref:pantetheine hydrolase VNN2-like n=1 Tax=Panonychus citri TaxID=50023 RepID=UPI0023081391|nr:pantetheine hydrolase VNN2-like [Panonychus citri]